MKKLTLLITIFFVVGLVIAQGPKGIPNENPMKAQTSTELQEIVQERQQEMTKEMEGLTAQQQNMYQNQNQVRLAVHSLLASEELMGGIGPQVSEIARECDNSVQATINAEEKIATRNAFARFFAGGDKVTGQQLEQLTIQNQNRIQEMTQLMENCECGEEVKTMLQEQLQNMEQEQTRLKTLAQNEIGFKGMFCWLRR